MILGTDEPEGSAVLQHAVLHRIPMEPSSQGQKSGCVKGHCANQPEKNLHPKLGYPFLPPCSCLDRVDPKPLWPVTTCKDCGRGHSHTFHANQTTGLAEQRLHLEKLQKKPADREPQVSPCQVNV